MVSTTEYSPDQRFSITGPLWSGFWVVEQYSPVYRTMLETKDEAEARRVFTEAQKTKET